MNFADEEGRGAAAGQRVELRRLRERASLTLDEARPEAVARRHAAGSRTARENLADLVDPGSFVEYGRFAIAAQRGRRELDDLVANTPADGVIGGTARINGDLFGPAAECAVLSYDYTVLAGTQGVIGHRKKDRLFEQIEKRRLPVVFFAEGGGGRPGDTDIPTASWLETRTFETWARLAGAVPRIAIVHGHCFAGNAMIAGCSDLIVATEGSSLGMGGPAMIEGGGLGRVTAADVGPAAMQARNGVVDVLARDEAEATAIAKTLLSCFQGTIAEFEAADQLPLREIVPERNRRAFAAAPVIETLADAGSVTFLGAAHAPEMTTALARIEGVPVGVFANDSRHMAGAITAAGATKAARLMELCDAHGIALLSLLDTPGMMVGPAAEETGLVRAAARLLNAGATLRVPLLAVVMRRAYGLGAQAMMGGSTWAPSLTLAWPGAHLGPMGLEGGVRLGHRRELEGLDEERRERRVAELLAAAEANAEALNAAAYAEIDDVVDPAETRAAIARTLRSALSAR